MPAPKTVLVTGVTGFLGSHLAARLLDEGHRVIALARGSKNASPQERVERVMRDVGSQRLGNLEVVEGDISAAGLGLNESIRKRVSTEIDELWHSAASLSFEQE